VTGAARKIVAGWQVSGVLTAQSGPPFDISSGFNPSWLSNGFVSGYPDLVAGAQVNYDTRNTERYFDPSAFSLPPVPGFIGNLARTFGKAPGIAKLDVVLTKSTPLFDEKVNLQFRSEFYNILNRANFNQPASAVFDSAGTGAFNPTVGQIRSTTTISRQIQFGLKVLF
jgi:hypothetical protein